MDNYLRLEQIGRGSFGTVHKIKRLADRQIMVWKELDYGKMSDKEKQLVVGEVNILRELRHPYILRYHDRIIDKKTTKLYIIVEYCERGDLRHLIKRAKASRTFVHEQRIWKYFAQILSALKTCHRRREKGSLKPILHRDIKPANVFLDRNDNAKLGDFGLARTLDSMSKFAYTNVGTPFYMSPEQTNSKKYDERSDIWAVGCLLYELAALRPPFHAQNQLALAMKINAGRFDRIPKHYSENLYRAIRWMLHTEPTRRPRVEDLENLPEIRAQHASWAASGQNTREKDRAAMPPPAPRTRSASTTTANQGKDRTAPGGGSDAAAAGNEKQKADTVHAKVSTTERESAVREREARVADAEARVARREADVAKRETRIKLREEALLLREESLARREKRLARATSAATGVPSSSTTATTKTSTAVRAPSATTKTTSIATNATATTNAVAPTNNTRTSSSNDMPPPAPRAPSTFLSAAPCTTTSGDTALEAAKKRLQRMATKGKSADTRSSAALGDIGNKVGKYRHRANVGEWSAQAQVDEILRKAKQRTATYHKRPSVM